VIGLVVNPIAGMGGRVGLKGTDGVVKEALAKGAQPIAGLRAAEAIATLAEEFGNAPDGMDLTIITCSGPMGTDILRNVPSAMARWTVIVGTRPSDEPFQTARKDTMAACKAFRAIPVDLVLFCGGDGTAKDVHSILGGDIPMLGIPAGVKMHSGVFAVNPEMAGKVACSFLTGDIKGGEAEVMDLDEEAYRKGEWTMKLFGIAVTPRDPGAVQVSKFMGGEGVDEERLKNDMAYALAEDIRKDEGTLYILGPGSTVSKVSEKLKLQKTLLGLDAILGGPSPKSIGNDLDESTLLGLLRTHPKAKLLLSPIGGQGFILGRGNLQLSPEAVRRVGLNNIIVLSTPSKMAATPILRVDTGDENLDKEFARKEYISVIIGERTSRLYPVKGR